MFEGIRESIQFDTRHTIDHPCLRHTANVCLTSSEIAHARSILIRKLGGDRSGRVMESGRWSHSVPRLSPLLAGAPRCARLSRAAGRSSARSLAPRARLLQPSSSRHGSAVMSLVVGVAALGRGLGRARCIPNPVLPATCDRGRARVGRLLGVSARDLGLRRERPEFRRCRRRQSERAAPLPRRVGG